MKTIKFISNHRKGLIENIPGDNITLPEDSNAINSYIYPNELENESYYIIEVSPDDINPLNFNGVKIGMQLYFKHIQDNKLNFQILFIGFESKADFFFDCEYALFLKCPNVTYQQINLDFKINFPTKVGNIDKQLAIEQIKKINIKPPTSYKTHHSISNEWAISRWSQYLGFNTALDSEIEKSLYFQYLKTIYQIPDLKETQSFLVSDGNLLLIDDEEAKGWSEFYNKLKLPSSSLKIESIGKNFKSGFAKEDIITKCENKIIEFKPQTIILDLRLHDSDFEEDNPTKLTGYQILQKIKGYYDEDKSFIEGINPGIQVILFTASNKVWNYQALKAIGFDGWITKESPELSIDPSYTQKAIVELKRQIDFCQKRARFLIKISDEINRLKELIQKNNLFESEKEETKKKFFSNLNITFDLLEKATQSKDFEKYFNYAYLQLFLIIEEWLKHETVFIENEGSCFVINAEKKYLVRKPTVNEKEYYYAINWKEEEKKGFYEIGKIIKKNSKSFEDTMFKMSAVLLFKFGIKNLKVHIWKQISWIRNNKIGHANDNDFVSKDEIVNLIDFILFIFNSDNYYGIDESKALTETSL
jgi:CheY-like chemotaxis protein